MRNIFIYEIDEPINEKLLVIKGTMQRLYIIKGPFMFIRNQVVTIRRKDKNHTYF